MKQISVRIEEGLPLVENLEKFLASSGIKEATIVSAVGALREFELITIYQNSQKIPPEHFSKSFSEKVELLGNGRVKDGKVHLHVSLGAEGGKSYTGHLVEGIVTYFVDIVFLVG